ncbi:hypothetical protein L4D06_01080 [Enterovibrio makurazakiensis]|uniref:hypothetical protein n=1 Tax=Enterovibrio makurazakiensis TaxID=2910232 RepID=UPI003D2066A7
MPNKLINFRWDMLIVFFLIIYPILNNQYALWDGVILNYAIETNNRLIISTMFLEAGAPLVAGLHYAIYELSNFSGVSGKSVYSFLIAGISFLLYFEFVRILSFSFKISNSKRVLISILFVALPFWSSFLSDIYINYLICIYLTFLSVNLLLREKFLLALFFGVFAIALKVNIYFHLILFLFIFLVRNYDFRKLTWQYYIVYLSLVAFFVLREIFLVPSGQYVGYNGFSLDRIVSFFLDTQVYSKLFFIIPLAAAFAFSIIRMQLLVFLVLSVGLVGIFYLADKINYVSILELRSVRSVHPYDLRTDITFHLYVLVLSSAFILSVNSRLKNALVVLILFLVFLPQKYFADMRMARMINEIESVYEFFEVNRDLYLGKEGLMYTEIEGISVGNYHLYKIFGNSKIITSKALGTSYQDRICVDSTALIYRQKGICEGFTRWDTLLKPKIIYGEYDYMDLWK